MSNSVEEDLNDGYFVLDPFEKGVEAHVRCVLDPFVVMGVGGGGSTRSNSALDVFLRKAEVAAEIICGVGVTSCQDTCCG